MSTKSSKRKISSDFVNSSRKRRQINENEEDKENPIVNTPKNSKKSNSVLSSSSIPIPNNQGEPLCSKSISNASSTSLNLNLYAQEIEEIQHNLSSNKFPPKVFKFGDIQKNYSSVLNFFHCRTEFDSKPPKKEKLQFTCIYCYKVIHEPLGKSGNFFKHFNSTQCKGKKDFKAWKKVYDEFNLNETDDDSCLDDDIMDLTKYVISSNTATQELSNIHLKRLLERHKIHLPCLRKAKTVTLIGDIWDSRQMADFFALCCQVTFADFSKKLIVLGLKRMNGPHNAENIIDVTEQILNQYDFDKSKVAKF